ncbi:DNA invertase Pin-like site-specific DNA recombinase [Filimonas zeae]|uniref:recombinase family protein n=1 Tax=Filimonas zeae TaxID=1737353 RepID=UPI00166D0C49|nr:recombinase family protein [Filimonas zeae]MDR6337397.1 DNA invertase Pin-like site-specific DNA recombinase [Filimonas zeae]
MKIADLYIRVSTEEQKTTGFSQRYQEEILKSYCVLNSIEVDKVVFEDYSAKTFNRPEWKKLFASYLAQKQSTPRLLLVTKWDRFSRNTGEAYHMIKQLANLHIEVKAIDQPLDTSIPESKIMMAFYLALPEVENERRGLNIKQGIDRGLREGKWMGHAPVGYVNKITEDGIKYIEPVEPYAGLMRMAFHELAKGVQPVGHVYKTLTKSGFSKSIHCFWQAIRNPIYCGKILLKSKNQTSPVYIQGQHSSIVSTSLFEKVQQIISRKKIHPRKNSADKMFPFRGFLRCPVCNKCLTGSGSTGKKKKVYYYYHCQRSQHTRIPIERIHSQFSSFIAELIPNNYFKDIYQLVVMDLLNENLIGLSTKQNKLVIKIEMLNYKIERARSLLLSSSIDVEDYRIMKKELETEKGLLQSTLAIVSNETSRITNASTIIVSRFYHLDTLFEELSIIEKKELISMIFPYGIVYSEASFSLSNMAESLQLIYRNTILPFKKPHRKTPKEPIQDLALLDNKPFLKKFISDLISNHITETIKQAKDIVTFFRRVAELSIRIATSN